MEILRLSIPVVYFRRLYVLLAFLLVMPRQGVGQACTSQPNVNYCSPTGATCSEPVEGSPATPGNPAATNAWTPNSTISVNVNTTGLQPQQVSAIELAFSYWQGVDGVSFTISESTASIPETAGTFNVSYGNTPPNYGDVSHPSQAANGTVEASETVISTQATTCLVCMTKIMDHAIAHTFGLDDNNIPGSAIQDGCYPASQGYSPNNIPDGCQSATGPTQADMAAVNCDTNDSNNQCFDTDNSPAAACQCGAGTSGDCSGGLTCQSDGTCGCTDACDDPYCAGWTQSCGTCRDDGDCAGSAACQNGACVATCPGDAPCPGAACTGGSWDTSECFQCTGSPCDGAVCTGENVWDTSACCTDVCNSSCLGYDPSQCYGGGGPGDGGGNCGFDCEICGEYEDCWEYWGISSPGILKQWLPVGVSLALVLPFMIDVRRRRKGED